MKRIFKVSLTAPAALFAVLAATASPVAAKVCIRTADIKSDHSPDARTILFTMNDGTVWRNTLESPCPGLKYNGFAWLLQGEDQVCDNEQSISVLESHQVCLLGAFDKVTPHKKSDRS